MSEIKKHIYLEDGRRAERRIVEQQSEDCQSETVTELWEEKPLPKYLTQRIVEKKQLMPVERETQVMGEDGQTVVETRKETLDDYKLQVREVTKFNVVAEEPKKECQCDDVLGKIQKVVTDAVQPLRDDLESVKQDQVDLRQELGNKQSMRVSAQSVLGEKLEDEKKINLWDVAGLGVILAQIGAVVYFLLYF